MTAPLGPLPPPPGFSVLVGFRVVLGAVVFAVVTVVVELVALGDWDVVVALIGGVVVELFPAVREKYNIRLKPIYSVVIFLFGE